jgi:hypothetical protein
MYDLLPGGDCLKKVCTIIVIVLLIIGMFSGCRFLNKRTEEDDSYSSIIAISPSGDIPGVETGEYAERIDKLIKKYVKDGSRTEKHPFIKEFEKADVVCI